MAEVAEPAMSKPAGGGEQVSQPELDRRNRAATFPSNISSSDVTGTYNTQYRKRNGGGCGGDHIQKIFSRGLLRRHPTRPYEVFRQTSGRHLTDRTQKMT